MTADSAFRIDYEYDGDKADHAGGSRFANYVRINENWFADSLDWPETAPANFAATSWRVANGPVMSPGYVRWHPRILSTEIRRSDWDEKLLACVDLITPPPEGLRWSPEHGGRRWRGWPAESLWGRESYHEPGGQDLALESYILPSVSLRWAFPDSAMPTPPMAGTNLDGLQRAARHCVGLLVAELNRTVNPVLAQLERSLCAMTAVTPES